MPTTINGNPWYQQNFFNDSSATDISTFSTNGTLSATATDGQVVMTKNRVYLLSNYNNANCYTASIDSSGNIGSWSSVTTTLPQMFNAEVIVTSSRVYILGGKRGGTESTPWTATWSDKINYAEINSDGTLGTFYEDSITLPITPYDKAVFFVVNGKLYYIRYNNTYVSEIDDDGVIGSFSDTGLAELPNYSTYQIPSCSISITSERVYLLGGRTGATGHSAVRYAEYDSEGVLGEWSSGTSLPQSSYSAYCVTIEDYVFLIGGLTGTGLGTYNVYGAPIDSSGIIGTWGSKTSMPAYLSHGEPVVTSSKIYLLANYVAGSASTTIYSSSFSGGLNDYTEKVYADPPPSCSIVSPMASFHGVGDNPIIAWVDISPPLASMMTADMIVCYGWVTQPNSVVGSVAATPIYAWANTIQPDAELSAEASSQQFSWGRYVTPKPILFSDYGSDSKVNSKAPQITSTCTMTYPARAYINTQRVSVSASMIPILSMTGRISPQKSSVRGRIPKLSGSSVITYRR